VTAAEQARCERVRVRVRVRVTGALPKGDIMTTAVIGAAGRVGREASAACSRGASRSRRSFATPTKARRSFGEPDGLHLRC